MLVDEITLHFYHVVQFVVLICIDKTMLARRKKTPPWGLNKYSIPMAEGTIIRNKICSKDLGVGGCSFFSPSPSHLHPHPNLPVISQINTWLSIKVFSSSNKIRQHLINFDPIKVEFDCKALENQSSQQCLQTMFSSMSHRLVASKDSTI